MILGTIGVILGYLGVYGFFTGNLLLVFIGGAAGIAENVRGISTRKQKTVMPLIIFSTIAVMYSISVKNPWWIGLLVGACFETAVTGMISIVALICLAVLSRANKGSNDEE